MGCVLPDPRMPCLLLPSHFRIFLGLGSGTGCRRSSSRNIFLGVSTCLRNQFPGGSSLLLQLGHLHFLLAHSEYVKALCRVMGPQSVGLMMGLVGRVGRGDCG